jgi:hypothetical protein
MGWSDKVYKSKEFNGAVRKPLRIGGMQYLVTIPYCFGVFR